MQQTTVNMCVTDHNKLTFTTVEQKIAWEYLEAYLRYTDFAKTAYFKHFKHFPATENLKNEILQQTTVNMCVTDHNKLTFTTVEQKIAWEYLEAYLRYTDFA